MKKVVLLSVFYVFLAITLFAEGFEKDTYQTSKGQLVITCIGHGTLMMEFDGKVIHIDPVGQYADYSKLPKADFILVTHDHGDHLDAQSIKLISKENTEVVLPEISKSKLGFGTVMNNGEKKAVQGIPVEAVPAYNIKHLRDENMPFHPKGNGNGYVLAFGDKKVYVAGDTENTPEMKALQNIDIAFLPMNLPYTMTPEMVADAAKTFKPKILYPYHFGKTDTNELLKLLEKENAVEVFIRKLN